MKIYDFVRFVALFLPVISWCADEASAPATPAPTSQRTVQAGEPITVPDSYSGVVPMRPVSPMDNLPARQDTSTKRGTFTAVYVGPLARGVVIVGNVFETSPQENALDIEGSDVFCWDNFFEKREVTERFTTKPETEQPKP